jgi:hypothetical protein
MAERPVKKSAKGEALKAYNETRKRLQEEKAAAIEATTIKANVSSRFILNSTSSF